MACQSARWGLYWCDVIFVLVSVCRTAPGTLICRERDMTDVLMTSIVLKTSVTLLDIVSTRMLGQFGFLSKVGHSQ